MNGDRDRPTEKNDADVKDSRRDRLKLALRENLKRRKSQARGRSDASASSESADASLDTASGEKP
jgi:tRNA A37 threonylcarbamoyladenosine dehydratase